MKKRGFTLIEIIGVVILLGVLSLIAVPTVNIIIKNGKEKALETTIKNLEEAAYNYSNRYDIGYSSETKSIQISELKKTGYIKDENIINPVTNSELEGCILYRWDENNKQYEFNYDSECVIRDLEVNITNLDGIFNEQGWAKKDFWVNIDTNGTGTSYTYCISNKKCSPSNTIDKSNGSTLIVLESDNVHVCAYASYKNSTSEIKCSEIFKLDKTSPEAGTINITGTKGENEWYISSVDITAVDGYDNLSGHLSTDVDIKSITKDTTGQKVVVTTTDNAGNTSTRDYTIKVDVGDPSVTIAKTVENNKNILTATTGAVTSGYSYEWYKDGKLISGETKDKLITTEAGTYKLKVTTGSGKSIESNEIKINSYMITYNNNGGTGNIASTVKIEDLSVNITNDKPTRDGYTFMGWGLTDNDKEPTYVSGSTYIDNASKELFAIWKKTITIAFNANGSTLSKTSATCDMYNADKNCTITVPTITRDTFLKYGYSTNKDGVKSDVTIECNDTNKKCEGITTSVSTNTTYYAITSKDVTITFNKNGAASIGSTSQSCTIKNSATNCSVTSPTITGSTNTPNVIGWDSTSPYTSNEWSVGTSKTFTDNKTYYAVTSSTQGGTNIVYTATFNANGATLVDTTNTDSNTKDSCTIYATFNGEKQATTCIVHSPKITAPSNTSYVIGFNTANDATAAKNLKTSTWSQDTSKEISSNVTYYAVTSSTQGGTNIVYTATFNANGATLVDTTNTDSNTKDSCTIYATFNGEKQATTCTVHSPKITAPSNTSYVIGFNTASDATAAKNLKTSTWSQDSSKEISSNVTYYAVTSSTQGGTNIVYTATFNANGATLVDTTNTDSNAKDSCTIYATFNGEKQATTCTVHSPNITRTGYAIVGFGTSSTSETSAWNVNTSKSISSNVTYYAITKKIEISLSPTSGTTYVGGSSLTSTITAKNAGTLKCTSPDTAIATCSISGSTLTMTPGTKAGNVDIIVSGSVDSSVTAKYSFNSLDPQYPVDITFSPENKDWTNEEFYVTLTLDNTDGLLSSFKVCTKQNEACDFDKGSNIVTFNGVTTADRLIATNGVNKICVQATDKHGRKSAEICSGEYKLDTVNPKVIFSSPGGTYNVNQSITVTVEEDNLMYMNVFVYKDNAYVEAKSITELKGNNSYTVTLDSPGTWRVQVYSIDLAHNIQTQTPIFDNIWYYQTYVINEPYICSSGELTYDQVKGANSGGYICVDGSSTAVDYTNGCYSCPVSSTYEASPDTYYCPNGGTLSGTTCIVSGSTYNASPDTYYCPDGGTLSGTTCTITTASTCPSSHPSKILSSAAPIYSGNPEYACYKTTSKNVCQSGYTYSGGTCYQVVAPAKNGTCGTGYTICPYATVSCCRTGDLPVCPSGYSYSNSTTCWNWVDVQCPSDFNGKSSNRDECIKTYSASPKTYKCPNGGTLSGTTCKMSDTSYDASPKTYKCPDGGTLSGTTCTKSETVTDCFKCGGYTSYYCKYGWYSYSGSGSNLICYKAATTNK